MKWFNLGIIIIFIFLLLANVYIVVVEINYANKIIMLEEKLAKIKKENNLLEQKLGYVSSLEYISSQAAKLDFTAVSEPIPLESIKQAYNNEN